MMDPISGSIVLAAIIVVGGALMMEFLQNTLPDLLALVADQQEFEQNLEDDKANTSDSTEEVGTSERGADIVVDPATGRVEVHTGPRTGAPRRLVTSLNGALKNMNPRAAVVTAGVAAGVINALPILGFGLVVAFLLWLLKKAVM